MTSDNEVGGVENFPLRQPGIVAFGIRTIVSLFAVQRSPCGGRCPFHWRGAGVCRVVSWELDALPGEGAGIRHAGGTARSTQSDSTSISGASEQRFSATQAETITRQLDEGVR